MDELILGRLVVDGVECCCQYAYQMMLRFEFWDGRRRVDLEVVLKTTTRAGILPGFHGGRHVDRQCSY